MGKSAWAAMVMIAVGCAEPLEPSETAVVSEIGGCDMTSNGWPCDDNNACTLDQCVAGQCTHAASSTCPPSSDWYVAPPPFGSMGGNGTKTAPWTLDYAGACAGGRILAGDRVNIAGGTYWGSYTISCGGSASRRITYIAAVQRRPVIDAAIQAFTTAGGWEPYSVTPSKHIYRSKLTYESPNNYHYVGFIKPAAGQITLIVHGQGGPSGSTALSYLSSDIHDWAPDGTPRYVGPGTAYNPTDKRIYIRLDNSPSSAQRGRPVWQIPTADPNQWDIRLAPYTSIGLRVTGSFVTVDGLAVATAGQGLNTNSPDVTDVTFRNLDVTPGYFGARLGPAQRVSIETSTFHARMPGLNFSAAEMDIKGGLQPPADNIRKVGIDLNSSSYVTIAGNEFEEFHDGILSSNAVHDITLTNNVFRQTWDDSWQLFYTAHHINIGYNKFFGAGLSRDGTWSATSIAPNQGTVWIHHNVFAPHERQVWWYRGGATLPANVDPDGMIDAVSLSAHKAIDTSAEYGFPYKLYYNTFVVQEPKDASVSIGLIGHFGNVANDGTGALAPTRYDGAPHEVYNNIFIDYAGKTPGPTYWRSAHRDTVGGTPTGREMYDGNVYSGWSTSPIYRYVRLSDGSLVPNVMTPQTLRSNSTILAETKLYPIPSFQSALRDGWELRGFATSSILQLDACYAAVQANCPQCTTNAISLVGSGWPGTTTYEAWRGAVAPGTCL